MKKLLCILTFALFSVSAFAQSGKQAPTWTSLVQHPLAPTFTNVDSPQVDFEILPLSGDVLIKIKSSDGEFKLFRDGHTEQTGKINMDFAAKQFWKYMHDEAPSMCSEDKQ